MKHAFLIIAHNNFKVLDRLIKALDCTENDIFVHIDRKVREYPRFEAASAGLYLIEDRVDVRWGHVSQLEAEFALIENALSHGRHDWLHIISGTHFPLATQQKIDTFFRNMNGCSVFSPVLCSDADINFKLGYRHLFFGGQNSGSWVKRRICNIMWRICLKMQRCSLSRVGKLYKGKVSQWASLTGNDAAYILSHKKDALQKFRHTFCSDEFFMVHLFRTGGLEYVESDKVLYQKFPGASPADLKVSDLRDICRSGCLFARKFTDSEISLLELIGTNRDNG